MRNDAGLKGSRYTNVRNALRLDRRPRDQEVDLQDIEGGQGWSAEPLPLACLLRSCEIVSRRVTALHEGTKMTRRARRTRKIRFARGRLRRPPSRASPLRALRALRSTHVFFVSLRAFVTS